MAYGVFDIDGNHLVTYDYGNYVSKAEEMAKSLGKGYYTRELTSDEYWQRMREIFVLYKYGEKKGE